MHMWRRPAALALLMLFLAGCSLRDDVPVPVDDGAAAALGAQQRELSARALRTLENRTCAALPEVTAFADLPAAPLDCLGNGPARPANTGDGRPTVINLWASWCAPCVREMPLLQRTADRAGEGARFVGINVEDEEASAAGLLEATSMRYDQYSDPDGHVRSAVRAVGLPVTLVFDAQGREVSRRLGEIKGSWLEESLGEAGMTLAPSAPPAPVD
jgi:thiol-disulfide isomerase/thioredoxin